MSYTATAFYLLIVMLGSGVAMAISPVAGAISILLVWSFAFTSNR